MSYAKQQAQVPINKQVASKIKIFEVELFKMVVSDCFDTIDQNVDVKVINGFVLNTFSSQDDVELTFKNISFLETILKLDKVGMFRLVMLNLQKLVTLQMQDFIKNADKNQPNYFSFFPESEKHQDKKWDQQAVRDNLAIFSQVPHQIIKAAILIEDYVLQNKDVLKGFKQDEVPKIFDYEFCMNLGDNMLQIVGKQRYQVVNDRATFQLTNDKQADKPTKEEAELENEEEDESKVDSEDWIPELDKENKRTIMNALIFIAVKASTFNDHQASLIYTNLQWLPITITQYKVSDYVLKKAQKLIFILVKSQPNQRRVLHNEKQFSLVKRLIDRLNDIPEKKDRKRDQPFKSKLQNELFESAISYLESKKDFNNENFFKLFESMLVQSKGRSVHLKNRLFSLFERRVGPTLFDKLKYFFNSHLRDNQTRVASLLVISQLLDFLLQHFVNKDQKLEKVRHTAKLAKLQDSEMEFDLESDFSQKLSLEDKKPVLKHFSETREYLQKFQNDQKRYLQIKLESLMESLSEIISINPTYHDDKPIADILFTEIFWQIFNILNSYQQNIIADCILKVFQNCIKHSATLQQLFKPTSTFARTLLESSACVQPQIRFPPELLQYLASHLNLWHISIPIFENHIMVSQKNERYIIALSEIYNRLNEEDYQAGLRRMITKSNETRTIISLGQHSKWEQINQLFEQYIIFYADQEGIYAHLDLQQDWPGKYSRQLPRQFLLNEFTSYEQEMQARDPDAQNQAESATQRYSREFEGSVRDQIKLENFPRRGPNNDVSELDLCVWEQLFMESLKVLNKWEQYKDIAHLLGNGDHGNLHDQSPGAHEMWIEFFWQKKDWANLGKFRQTLYQSNQLRHQLYYIFLIIKEYDHSRFDEAFRKIIQSAHQEWETQLPNYVDKAQFESLILFQQVVESSEGGRSMIREARSHSFERLKELKSAMNIWRERIPHHCENIKTWKEILENRNFIFEQVCSYIIDSQNQNQIELLDICWNLVKLAEISRKHELPTLAFHYQEIAEKKLLDVQRENLDQVKFERFRLIYENLKLELQYNQDETFVQQKLESTIEMAQSHQNLEPWMKGQIRRVIAEHYLDQGKIKLAQEQLVQGIKTCNKREPKLWLSLARLNEMVLQQKGYNDSACFCNAMKGLMICTTLQLHKSRLLIPRIFLLLKNCNDKIKSKQVMEFVLDQLKQMPTWIWIFWLSQLLSIVQTQQEASDSVQYAFARYILDKLVVIYPWAIYYPLRSIFTFNKTTKQDSVQQLVKSLLFKIKENYGSTLGHLEDIGKEISNKIVADFDENLFDALFKLEFKTFQRNPDALFERVTNLVGPQRTKSQKLPLFLDIVVQKLQQDFINPETKENDYLKALMKLKNLKDFLLAMINSKDHSVNLEELSPVLAHFNERGVEIPGQYTLSEEEPLPQKIVYLDKLESTVQRWPTYMKLVFKGSNQKNYPFTTQKANNAKSVAAEERANQFKVLINLIFQRHKESQKRGIKLYVPVKLIMIHSILCAEELTFQDFQETHDYLLQEKGIDPDIAQLLQIQQYRNYLHNNPDVQLKDIKTAAIQQINADYFNCLIGSEKEKGIAQNSKFISKNLLSSYFQRIFYNVDDLFLFKKRFTTYHATNSFFTYSFNDTEMQSLSKMHFCKSSGKVSFQVSKLKSVGVNMQDSKMLKTNLGENYAKKIIERFESDSFATQALVPFMPFRLTPNFADFIGHIGIQGLFTGVMTSCSIACQKHNNKLEHFLDLLVGNEQASDTQYSNQSNSDFSYSTQLILTKINSLSNHEHIITFKSDPGINQQGQYTEDNFDFNNPDHSIRVGKLKVPKYMMQLNTQKPDMPEEFNRKVFKLIQATQEEQRMNQMLIRWCPWF